MEKWMKCIFPVTAKKAAAAAAQEVSHSIVLLSEQIEEAEGQVAEARSALRLLVASGGSGKEINVAIRVVDERIHRVDAKNKIRRGLQQRLGRLGDVEINSQVISAMRRTNGALTVAYGENEEQEDDALDLVEEFERLAETGQHVTGALEAQVISCDPESEEEGCHEVDDAVLARAMGRVPQPHRVVNGGLPLPEVPLRQGATALPAARANSSTNGTRAEIRALRL